MHPPKQRAQCQELVTTGAKIWGIGAALPIAKVRVRGGAAACAQALVSGPKPGAWLPRHAPPLFQPKIPFKPHAAATRATPPQIYDFAFYLNRGHLEASALAGRYAGQLGAAPHRQEGFYHDLRSSSADIDFSLVSGSAAPRWGLLQGFRDKGKGPVAAASARGPPLNDRARCTLPPRLISCSSPGLPPPGRWCAPRATCPSG